MKSDRGFSYDPDAVEAAENGTLKVEATAEATVEETKPGQVPETGDSEATIEGAVDVQVIDAIKEANGFMPETVLETSAEPLTEEQIGERIAGLDRFREALVPATEAFKELGESADAAAQAVAEMKRKLALVAEKAAKKLVRELRKADPKDKRTCAICCSRVPLQVIGGGKNDACDACMAAL